MSNVNMLLQKRKQKQRAALRARSRPVVLPPAAKQKCQAAPSKKADTPSATLCALNAAVIKLRAFGVSDRNGVFKKPVQRQKIVNGDSQKPSLTGAPDLSTLRLEQFTEAKTLPRCELATLACDRVLEVSDGRVLTWDHGGESEWDKPTRWMETIKTLDRVSTDGCGSSGNEWCTNVCFGEYNAVFALSQDAQQHIELPALRDKDGQEISFTEVVLRVTRTDSPPHDGEGAFTRYKPLEMLVHELDITLHGAANGYSPDVFAAFLFPVKRGFRRGKFQMLYGSVYILRKARADLAQLLETRTKACVSKDGRLCDKTETLFRSGFRAACSVIPTIFKQSITGGLNFDAKPSNYVVDATARVYAIDFDSSMYSRQSLQDSDWTPNLLLNLSLLTAHVKCFCNPSLSGGWSSAVRTLLLDLSKHSRGSSWLTEARIQRNDSFAEFVVSSPADCKQRLESMVHSYFSFPQNPAACQTPFLPIFGIDAPSLITQLIRYCIHGITAFTPDTELERALGQVK